VASSTTPSEPRALDLRARASGVAAEADFTSAALIAPALQGIQETLAPDSARDTLWARLARPGPAFVTITPEGDVLAAFGSVARFEASGPERFQAARRWLDAITAAAAGAANGVSGAPDSATPVPIAVGGFAFAEGSAGSPAGFGDAVFYVPAEIWSIGARPRRLTWVRTDGTGDRPRVAAPLPRPPLPEWTEAEWSEGVRAVLERIQAGELDKAVLARAVTIEGRGPIDAVRVFQSLARENPGCFRFLVRPSDATTFVGASPERLVSCHGGIVVSDAVAGTAADGELLTSAKDRSEHEFVVRHIVEALAPLATSLRADAEPSLQRHRRLTHLRTRIVGSVRPGTHVLDLVERVHPTPAVAGYPAVPALDLIRRLEPSHRGWYAGAIGWMSGTGDGDFAVGIRSALLHGSRAALVAGAGIVAGSDPASEWAETEVKLSVMREAIADAGC